MSDLSLPPLSLVPTADEAAAARQPTPDKGRHEPFAWPTPPLPSYPAPVCAIAPEACEVETLSGRVVSGRMTSLQPEEGVLLMQLQGSKTTMTVRFDQFRRLRLAQPLAALPKSMDDSLTGTLGERPALEYRVVMKAGAALEGMTVRHVETEFGLFLFEPLDAEGNVQRIFVPRQAYSEADIGPRIGQALMEEKLATPAQVTAALDEQQRLRERKLGALLMAQQIVGRDELTQAIEQQSRMPMVRIGEALVALGLITPEQLQEALLQQRQDRGVPLGELLVRSNAISRADLQLALSRKMGYPLVDVDHYVCERDAVIRVPYAVARRVPALPLLRLAGRLVVAMEDPTRKSAVDEIEFAAQCKVVPVLARSGVLAVAVDRAYERNGALPTAAGELNLSFPPHRGEANPDAPSDASKLLATLEQQGAEEADEEPQLEQSDNSLVKLINTMILEAQAQQVSDIHIECSPGREKVKIRFRRDGQLRPYMELPHTYRAALLARLKIMCDLDISERRKPQDGKINFGKFVQGQRLELRVATIPTHSGLEDAVLRLLASARAVPLDNLGLSTRNLEQIKAGMQRPHGMLLCVGPTGSGKTTTLHSAIGYINVPERKIWTAEDPIEITQPGLRQVQVNPKIDWTFAKALRAFLRADPDVVMVGEIRDQETAQIAIEASLTGHLVLSTLHTNSAAETVTRLIDMGMDPFNFADSLLAVLAQRLVRRLCTHCRTPREATPEEIEELLRDYMHGFQRPEAAPTEDDVLADWKARFGHEGKVSLYRSVGCQHCDHSGYRGRAGIHELLTVNRTMRHLIQTGKRSDELQQAALGEGMRTLRQDGIEKVLAGITSVEEVRANSY